MRKDRISTTIDLILLIFFTVSAIFLCIQTYLGTFLSFFWLTMMMIVLIVFLILMFIWILASKEMPWVRRIIMLLVSILLFVGAFYLGALRSEQSEANKIYTYYRMQLVSDDKEIAHPSDMQNKKIGVLMSDQHHIQSFNDLNAAFQIKDCTMNQYYSIDALMQAIERKEIQGMILSDYNMEIIHQIYPDLHLSVLSENAHEVEISHLPSLVNRNQPMVILISISEEEKPLNYVSYSNQCLLLFVDPLQYKISLIELPKNLYIPNVAYESYPDALSNVSYNGMDNLLYSLESIFDIEIDYFIKTNSQAFFNAVDIMQGIHMSYEECDDSACTIKESEMNAQQVEEQYQQHQDIGAIMKGIFEKRDELTATKLINFLSNYNRYTFSNFSSSELNGWISKINQEENWQFEQVELEVLMTSFEPCISVSTNKKYEVSIMDEVFLDKIYDYFLDLKHMEIMKNFEFDLDRMRHGLNLPSSNDKLITAENMKWKISSLFAFLPESINPLEVEKWQGIIHFEEPNFDPDAPIQPIHE